MSVRDHRDAADLIAVTSALPKEPRHDKRPHRDHQARCRAGHPVYEVSARVPEHRTDQEGELQDVLAAIGANYTDVARGTATR